jgi:integrase
MASLSIKALGGGKYKLRWRELVPGPDGIPTRGPDARLVRRARSLTVHGKDARDEAAVRIRRALLEEGEYQPPTPAAAPRLANMEQAALDWLAWKRTRCKARSVVTYATHMKRFFEMLRKVQGVGEKEPVLADQLSRKLVIECIRCWQAEGRSEAWVYAAARSIIDMWRWVSDDPSGYPSVPTPPREAKTILPRTPLYVAPPAPTIAELDACLRHLAPDAEQSRRVGVLMRFTGLRISQALALRRQDLDLAAATLTVTLGKSRQEQAERRTIPLSPHLIAEIQPWVEALSPDGYLFPAWGNSRNGRKGAKKDEAFRDAWTAATAKNEARQVVWAPPNRRIARPQHAFRAGFQAFMQSEGLAEEVIDALVGHHGRSLRGRHYAGSETLWDRMVEAMGKLPPIDWRGAVEDEGTNVIELVR